MLIYFTRCNATLVFKGVGSNERQNGSEETLKISLQTLKDEFRVILSSIEWYGLFKNVEFEVDL